ncbi:CEI_1a_G0008330.mRNA.1.CDS.1 [Saccharomyces cerevisiae]|nr:EM14S01-3B_G0042720.mRNA.1.CDS.1 [Saccharomyces cerevisiae]CAI4325779.1 AMH_1a_G0008380.mRNA.1.CDS.1 [Saccharomyces cerevisiae]CAI4332396.1 CEI_1a_G0008330.mRNA.1.CDS.1 [Saccharomyces cerevisiae]CAI6544037.1 AMH_1a_G0008380.mRNA.1.CDS.1 [Saccharomyces cerevisiae]CAI7188531.1 CEI_1a_G0008330.mRNA.1.CDS.1 [Saccharomyces cerevisiae]
MITEGFPPNLNASKGSSLLKKRVDSLRQLNTTTVNQLLGLPGMTSTFTAPQLLQLRIIAITASAVSLIAGCLGMFFLSKMDKRRKVFRHDLIAFLIICDFLKAFILMIYPMIILIDNSVYATPAFFNTLGWFTAFAIEGADMAIMIFAIHFAILIFKPNWKWRNKRSGNMEGGLYKKRSYIWPITALVPAILASLAFINYNKLNDDSDTTIVLDNDNYNFPDSPRQGGYKPWSAWCYLPPKPYWYKIVLSWGPRYFIIIFIFAVYLSIYIFITSESKRIKAQIGDFNHNVLEEEKEKKKLFGLGHWGKAKWYFRSYFKLPLLHLLRNLKNFFTISFIDPNEETDDSGSSNGTFNFGESSNEIPTLFRKTNTGSDENVSASGGVRLLDYNSTKPLDMSKYAMSEQPDLERNNPFDCENDITLNPSELVSKQKEHNVTFSVENEGLDTRKNRCENSSFTNVQQHFQAQTYKQMKKRRAQIQKNLRAIFIYPLSYIGIWLFPIIADALQYKHEIKHGPTMWVTYIATCVRPLSCLVDVIVYLFKEKPWNYSWAKTESKYLIEKYILKGELGEKEILKFCHSSWGKRGWYYRGKWKKRKCWKYSTNTLKRILWFVERFFKQLFELKLHFSFYDNCDDFEYWENYYSAKDSNDNKRTESDETKTNSSDRSLPSNSLELQAMLNNITAEEVEVPLFWRIIHHIPMLGGIDLDELNRSLKIRYNNDHFSLPGLKFALNQNKSHDKHQEVSTNSMVKSSFFSSNVVTNDDENSIEEDKNLRYSDALASEDYLVKPTIPGTTPDPIIEAQNDSDSSDSSGIDLIAFLRNGPL